MFGNNAFMVSVDCLRNKLASESWNNLQLSILNHHSKRNQTS